MPTVLVIIPAHNEADNLPHVLPAVREVAPAADILVVDDYSIDATGAVAAQLGATVVRLPNNLGYGGAVQAGFRFGARFGYDYGITMDADGQHRPEDIPKLIESILERKGQHCRLAKYFYQK
jgi:glycosyltransferase involved in cell wall biosynthesis